MSTDEVVTGGGSGAAKEQGDSHDSGYLHGSRSRKIVTSPANAAEPGGGKRVATVAPETLGLLSNIPRQGGYGPATSSRFSQKDYTHPAAGYGAAMSVTKVMLKQRQLLGGGEAVFRMNHDRTSYDCPGCAWPDDPKVQMDICENGIKHVTWEMDSDRTGEDFFARHTVSELSTWTDYDLEDQGRLTRPMSYDAATDKYVPISWDDAFEMFGEEMRKLSSANEASFYTSGRLSNEATFLYQLMGREMGTNNFPDCSNMCHEASGRALTASLGTGKGTCDLEDWEHADALFIMGVNAASNAPRMLTSLAEATRRGAQVIHINPLNEAGSTRTIVPHEISKMATFQSTSTGDASLQVRPGGDMALMRGIAKVTLEAAEFDDSVLDLEFLAAHAKDFEAYRELVSNTSWEEITRQSGLDEAAIRRAGKVYIHSEKTVISWCLGVTQHEHAVDQIREIVNLLMLRGNIGRPGAGPSPVRGHSNVQGNRTCGINHKPSEELLAALDREFGITSPREHGLDTVRTIEAMHDGDVKVFLSMGGNFVLATPDTHYTAEGLAKTNLTVQVSTKLNRSHLVHGKKALILPCLGRTERDEQAAGRQGVTVEDAMSMVHMSTGTKEPASEHLMSEPAILTRLARAAMPDSPIDWEGFAKDYDVIRESMSRVLPGFEGMNELIRRPGGFRIPQPARERDFRTPSGKAEFSLATLPDVIPADSKALVLQTMRSHDQWNTTIYANSDRYRGIKNVREMIMLNPEDMRDRGISEGDPVDITSTSRDGTQRTLRGYKAIGYNTPVGSAAGYMPEMNALMSVTDFSTQSDQPIMKGIEITVAPSA